MFLQIDLDGNNIKLTLKDGDKIVDEFSWIGEYSLSEQLLPSIDGLLEKNHVKKEEIEKIVAKTSETSGVTSSRIVQAVEKAWNQDGC